MIQGFLQHFRVTLRLYLRNKMALFYSYLFPVIFLVAYLVLYDAEQIKLFGHMGELLTVSVLGGACFGLPTTLVGERERGVWRRFRLAPVNTLTLVAGTLAARYLTVLCAGVIQLIIGMAVGGWVPLHPFHLLVAFTAVTFAMMGLGLVIATLADNVPAVQALGQCIFLPMLIIGGVAVKLGSLPGWALHVSTFFPGRYAVETMQATVTGEGLDRAGFGLFSLVFIGVAGTLAGVKLFRWDAQQKFFRSGNKAWVGVALAAWAVVGVAAEVTDRVQPLTTRLQQFAGSQGTSSAVPTPEEANAGETPAPTTTPVVSAEADGELRLSQRLSNLSTETADSNPDLSQALADWSVQLAATEAAAQAESEPWRALTSTDFGGLRALVASHPNTDNVTPIAESADPFDPGLQKTLDAVAEYLPIWEPAQVADPVQRVRNVLLVQGAVDYAQSQLEAYLPWVMMDYLYNSMPVEDLEKVLCWIAQHPDEGDDSVLNDEIIIQLNAANWSREEVHYRVQVYAAKFNWWLLGWL